MNGSNFKNEMCIEYFTQVIKKLGKSVLPEGQPARQTSLFDLLSLSSSFFFFFTRTHTVSTVYDYL